ncbi:MAG: hypothetical protein RLZZ350_1165 [Verrucomicrobiota bacterium]|jgi:triacylglycerol lipase
MKNPFAKFNPATTRWNANNALALAYAAQLAYADSDTVEATLPDWSFDAARVVFLERKDTQLFVAANDEMILVSFRGTQANDIWDWMTDAEIVLRPFTVGLVHKGFYDALQDVWAELLAAIGKFQTQGQSVWFTGHSLGASLACLAVARLVFEERKPGHGLYTFGQPRTGDYFFSEKFDHEFGGKTFRFVNDCDIVTRLPPRVLNYSHVGQLMFFDAQKRLQTDDHWWNKFLNSVVVGREGLIKPKLLVKQHAIERYIECMQKNLTTPTGL